jgi:hypothetical protein
MAKRDVGCEIEMNFTRDVPFDEGEFDETIPTDLKNYIENHILNDFIQEFGGVGIKNYSVIVDHEGILIEAILSVPQDITIDAMRTFIESLLVVSSNADDFTGSVKFTEYPTRVIIGGRLYKTKIKRGVKKSKRKTKRKTKLKMTRYKKTK